tara:strand:+ start:1029 stop:1658 length:630 start_codon:yes stop_codon:yes gene_type:complete
MNRLTALPIFRDEESHKYCWEPTNEWLYYSTTQVCNNKTPEALANIERYRYGINGWEARGNHTHWCLEQKMLGDDSPDPCMYGEWVNPLLNHEYWDDFEPIAVEHMLCDLQKSVGGTLDLLGYKKSTKQITLIDLKTQSKSGKCYSTNAQIGSYIESLKIHHNLEVDICRTVWARPGKTIIGKDQEINECVEEWNKAWEIFKEKQADVF